MSKCNINRLLNQKSRSGGYLGMMRQCRFNFRTFKMARIFRALLLWDLDHTGLVCRSIMTRWNSETRTGEQRLWYPKWISGYGFESMIMHMVRSQGLYQTGVLYPSIYYIGIENQFWSQRTPKSVIFGYDLRTNLPAALLSVALISIFECRFYSHKHSV